MSHISNFARDRELAIKAAHFMKGQNYQVWRLLKAGENGVYAKQFWEAQVDPANIMARFILDLDPLFWRFWTDISQWIQLAKAQREWFLSNHPDGTNAATCPTEAAIHASEQLLNSLKGSAWQPKV